MTSALTMAEASSLVCSVCLSANPSEISLITFGCFKPGAHVKANRVPVRWSVEYRRVERIRSHESSAARPRSVLGIRPMPSDVPPRGKRFIVCDRGWRCGGDRCTFAHSLEERESWNSQLLLMHSASSATAGTGRRSHHGEKVGGK